MVAVTFDYGQTLAELDMTFLARRVAERGATVDPERLVQASPAAWTAYGAAKARGDSGFPAWAAFMRALLEGAGTNGASGADPAGAIVDFLWAEQPRRNLWRRPLPGMAELVADLSARGVRLGVVSNSEGGMASLLVEMGLAQHFSAVADSGVLGFEKPDARIFEWTAERLGVAASDLIHVGDVWGADVEGALGVGARAVWITEGAGTAELPPRVVACRNAAELRSALRAWGIPA